MKQFVLIYISLILLVTEGVSQGSFAPEVGVAGSTAIYKDSSVFIGWATSCLVNRGPQNILDLSLGLANSGTPSNATGYSGQNGTVSLGDGGSAILEFQHPIVNGQGPDFAVFENAFNDYFLELAFVEVSTDGFNYVRFPSFSETQTTTQIGGFDQLDPTNIHNLAGKYKVNYGTPFDLEDLIDSSLIDINNINYVKIIDVIGIINDANTTFDSDNNMINDPYPTPYPTSGFDLESIGVIHQFVTISEKDDFSFKIYPNPSKGKLHIENYKAKKINIKIIDQIGRVVYFSKQKNSSIDLNLEIPKGIYILSLSTNCNSYNKRIVID